MMMRRRSGSKGSTQHHFRTEGVAKKGFRSAREKLGAKSGAGFTLIELLVVISIIGFLSSVVIASLSSARERGRVASAMKTHTSTHNALGAEVVGMWDLNDGSSDPTTTTANDGSGYGNHGTLVGGPVWQCDADPDNPPTPYHLLGEGDGRCSLEFDGAGNHVTVPSVGLLNFGDSQNFSVFLWIKTDTNGTSVVKYDDGNEAGWAAAHNASGTFYAWVRDDLADGGDLAGAGYNVSIDDDKWHHVGFTVDREAQTITTYVDGKYDDEADTSLVDSVSNTDPLLIGRYGASNSNSYTDGRITDVRVYAQALSASEVQTLYAQTAPRFLAAKERAKIW